jgi:hypothetical protein
MLIRYNDGASFAALIDKPWLSRGTCACCHSGDHALDIEGRRGWYLDEERRSDPLVVVSPYGEFRSYVATMACGADMNEAKFDIQVPRASEKQKAEEIKRKALWLAEQFLDRLKREDYSGRFEGVRFNDSKYILCFAAEKRVLLGIKTISVDQDVVDDMCDSPKPMPETKARFKAIVAQGIKEILKGNV